MLKMRSQIGGTIPSKSLDLLKLNIIAIMKLKCGMPFTLSVMRVFLAKWENDGLSMFAQQLFLMLWFYANEVLLDLSKQTYFLMHMAF